MNKTTITSEKKRIWSLRISGSDVLVRLATLFFKKKKKRKEIGC